VLRFACPARLLVTLELSQVRLLGGFLEISRNILHIQVEYKCHT